MCIWIIIIGINIWGISYERGYVKGGVVGYEMALDTIDKIIVKNISCDTCVSKLTIVTKFDTNTYYISKKLIK